MTRGDDTLIAWLGHADGPAGSADCASAARARRSIASPGSGSACRPGSASPPARFAPRQAGGRGGRRRRPTRSPRSPRRWPTALDRAGRRGQRRRIRASLCRALVGDRRGRLGRVVRRPPRDRARCAAGRRSRMPCADAGRRSGARRRSPTGSADRLPADGRGHGRGRAGARTGGRCGRGLHPAPGHRSGRPARADGRARARRRDGRRAPSRRTRTSSTRPRARWWRSSPARTRAARRSTRAALAALIVAEPGGRGRVRAGRRHRGSHRRRDLVPAPGAPDHDRRTGRRAMTQAATDAEGDDAVPADLPIVFDDPADAELSWDRDDMHMPFAMPPLAADWVRHVIGASFNLYFATFDSPQRISRRRLERVRLLRVRGGRPRGPGEGRRGGVDRGPPRPDPADGAPLGRRDPAGAQGDLRADRGDPGRRPGAGRRRAGMARRVGEARSRPGSSTSSRSWVRTRCSRTSRTRTSSAMGDGRDAEALGLIGGSHHELEEVEAGIEAAGGPRAKGADLAAAIDAATASGGRPGRCRGAAVAARRRTRSSGALRGVPRRAWPPRPEPR